jgi:excisionase family DNA binding protein
MNYSVATLADRWQCSRQHVYGMINRGELRAFKLGAKLYRIPSEEVEKCETLSIPQAPPEGGASHVLTKKDYANAARLARLRVRMKPENSNDKPK